MTNDLNFLKRLIAGYICLAARDESLPPEGASGLPSVSECLDFYAGVVAGAERREVSLQTEGIGALVDSPLKTAHKEGPAENPTMSEEQEEPQAPPTHTHTHRRGPGP